MRWRRAIQDDIAGFIAAATAIGSHDGREHDTAASVDDRLLGHRAHRGVGEHEVTQSPVLIAADAVDTGHEREFVGAGVVRPGRLRTHPWMQASRDDVYEQLVLVANNRPWEVFEAGYVAE